MSIIGLNGLGTVIGQSKTPPLAINTVDGYGYTNWHDGGGPDTTKGTPAYAEAYFGATPTSANASEFSRNLADEALSFIDIVHTYGQESKAPGYRTTMYDPAKNQTRASGMKSQLMQAARLIIAGSPGRVYYASSECFDTHSGQVYTQTSLLAEVSESIAEFLNYLA